MKLFGDICDVIGFAAFIITDKKLSSSRSAVYPNKLTFQRTDVWKSKKFQFHNKP
jgi:hypothetical protein